jgi:hypothetical protein
LIEPEMKAFETVYFGTETILLLGGVAALLIATGTATISAFVGFGLAFFAVKALAPLLIARVMPFAKRLLRRA